MPKFPAKSGGGKGGGQRNNLPMLPTKIIEPRCHVCMSEYREEVDRALMRGFSQASVCRHFQALGATFNRKNLNTHANKHLTLGEAAIRGLIESEAKKMALDTEEATGSLITKYAVLKGMLYKGFEDVMSGKTKVEGRDLIVVVDKLAQIEAEQEKVAVDELIATMNSFVQALKSTVDDATWNAVYELFEKLEDTRKGVTLDQMVTFDRMADEPKMLDTKDVDTEPEPTEETDT